MNWKFWKKPVAKKADIRFADVSHKAYIRHPIQMAKDVPAHFQKYQIEKYGKFPFAACPGMIDLKNYGYIVPAWDDIHLKANRAGFIGSVGISTPKRQSPFNQPKPMDIDIVDGVFTPKDMPVTPIHIGSPWAVIVENKDISAFVIPAVYHSSFLDDLYVFPGIVDYADFTSLTFICAAKRELEITIKAGEPLLQVVPFEVGSIKAGYGPASQEDIDRQNAYYATCAQTYRKFQQRKKPTTIET
jgi:hypothetical protein